MNETEGFFLMASLFNKRTASRRVRIITLTNWYGCLMICRLPPGIIHTAFFDSLLWLKTALAYLLLQKAVWEFKLQFHNPKKCPEFLQSNSNTGATSIRV